MKSLPRRAEPLQPDGDEHPAQDHHGGQDVGHQIRDEPGQRGERRAEQESQRDVGGTRGLQQGAAGQHRQQGRDQGRLDERDPPFRQRRRGGEMGEDGPGDRAHDVGLGGGGPRPGRAAPRAGRVRRRGARDEPEGLLHRLAALVEIGGAVEEDQRPAVEQGGPEQQKDRGQEKRKSGGHWDSLRRKARVAAGGPVRGRGAAPPERRVSRARPPSRRGRRARSRPARSRASPRSRRCGRSRRPRRPSRGSGCRRCRCIAACRRRW